jgi:sulfonate transport system substrate-binding protein
MKRIIPFMMAVCVGSAALTGCSGKAAATQPVETTAAETTKSEETAKAEETTKAEETVSDLDKLTFTYVTSPLNIPTIIERDQNVFAETFSDLGIEVDYAEITSGADQTQALASGDVQVLYAVGATSVILSAANGADIKVLNMYSRSPKAFCLYSSDETLTTPESLKGKTVAGPMGTNLHELLAAYLATADMTVDDVNFVNMSIPDARAGLENGSVDVAMIAGPAAYQAQKQGLHLVTDGEGLIQAIIAVAVRSDFYEEHPEVIERLSAAQDSIAAFMNDHPDETAQIVADALDLDTEAVEEMSQYYDFSLDISDTDIEGFQKTADFMLEAGMIDEALDVNTLFFE